MHNSKGANRIMMDKSIPYIGVLMTCQNPVGYPRCPLPKGYEFRTYAPGMEQDWAVLQAAVEHAGSVDEALALFQREFGSDADALKQRAVFVYAADGRPVASAVLWSGEHFGRKLARVHWVAVAPEEQGKGLCKALMTRLMDLYHELHLEGGVYLTSQTWSYKALNIYRQFGFKPYLGPRPAGWKPSTDDFEQETREAWDLIEAKLKAYRETL